MNIRQELRSFGRFGWHKGFYNDEDIDKSLRSIGYSDFFAKPDDLDFPYDSARSLLCGSCHHFALSLQKQLNYKAYIIEETNDKEAFHAFCQIYRNGKWFYVDARGITSSFDEFMDVASKFVRDEYTIRPVSEDDISNWETDSDYNKEAYEFAEAVIRKYEECYTL